jgi:hypothetical protein
MAKRTSDTQAAGGAKKRTAPAAANVNKKVVQAAERVGKVVGTVQGRAEAIFDRWDVPLPLKGRGRSARTKVGATPGAVRKSAAPAGRSGGVVDAPGKRHRKPVPSAHGVKHSDERIAKLRLAAANRRRRG